MDDESNDEDNGEVESNDEDNSKSSHVLRLPFVPTLPTTELRPR